MNLRKTSPLFILLILSLIVIGCGAQTTQHDQQNKVSKENPEAMMHNQNTFTFRLFEQAIHSDTDKDNRLISPLSIYMDFAMLYNGASGETKKAMQQALHIQPGTSDQLNRMQWKLMKERPKSDSAVTIDMENAIWHRKNLNPKSKVLSANQTFSEDAIRDSDFGNAETVADVNS